MVAAVAGEDQVAGELALGAAASVHLRRVQHPGGALDEGVREVGRARGFGRAVERLRGRHAWLERLERDAHAPLAAVRGVGVRDLGREPSVVGPDHERPSVLDGGPEREGGPRQPQVRVHLVGEPRRLLRRQVPADAAVLDLGPAPAGEVDPIGEVAVAEVHADPGRLEHPATGMLLVGVVAEDPEHADVRLRRDPGADGDDGAGPAPARQGVEVRRVGRLERRTPVELRDRVVPEPVEAHEQQLRRHHDRRPAVIPTSRSTRSPPDRGSRRRRAPRRSRGAP